MITCMGVGGAGSPAGGAGSAGGGAGSSSVRRRAPVVLETGSIFTTEGDAGTLLPLHPHVMTAQAITIILRVVRMPRHRARRMPAVSPRFIWMLIGADLPVR